MFKIVLKSLTKRKLVNIFIIIQLTITSIFLFYVFTRINSHNYIINQLKSKKIDRNNVVHVKFYNRFNSKESIKDFNELKNYISSVEGVIGCGSYDFTGLNLVIGENNEGFEWKRKNIYKDSVREDTVGRVQVLNIDYDIYKLMNVDIAQGRALTTDDFHLKNKDVIPILVGSKFKDIVKINDTFQSDKNNYKVVGILEKDSSWFNKHKYYANLLKDLDDKFIIGFTEDQNNSMAYIGVRAQNLFYINDNRTRVDQTKKLIDYKIEQLKFRGECKTINEEISIYNEEVKETLKLDFFMMALLTILSCSGISTTVLSSIISRKRELGIRVSVGASVKQLKSMILLELYSLGVVSTIIAMAVTIIDNYNQNQYYKLSGLGVNPMNNIDIKMTLLNIIIILLIITLTAIIPLNRIDKLSAKELIGGID